VRLRTRDYEFYTLPSDGWRVVGGSAELVSRIKQNVPSQEARITFSPDANTASFEFEIDLADLGSDEGGLSSADLDRVYVGFRTDASWARVVFEAIRDGQLYRAESPYSLSIASSTEQELRFEPDPDTMKRRAYYLLEPVGPAPEGSPAFALQAHVTRNSAAGAWFDKITSNYRQTFREVNFLRYISTSFALTILNIVLAIFSCTLVAYAFARLPWPGRNVFFGILMATMMIPPQVTMIPAFLVHKYLGWYNTLLPMWVGSLFGAPFFVFLLRQFFKNVPRDLEEAARIDGCGFLRVYWHVMLPLVKPTVATIAIFTFMATWNNFMGPLIYVNDERLFPLALGLFKFSLGGGSDVGQMMAGAFIMTLPIIVLFFFAQRYFIQGISLTGTKG
jgi:ABC-type glycerol-3-phosphate transport system permease component